MSNMQNTFFIFCYLDFMNYIYIMFGYNASCAKKLDEVINIRALVMSFPILQYYPAIRMTLFPCISVVGGCHRLSMTFMRVKHNKTYTFAYICHRKHTFNLKALPSFVVTTLTVTLFY